MNDEASALLGIYLHDHMAASVAGRELVRRTCEAEKANEFGQRLRELLAEIESDARELRAIGAALEVGSRAPVKERAAWIAEKLGRLKLNGHLVRRSPLSLLVELEGLQMAVNGKRALWQTLIELAKSEPRLGRFDLTRLLARADDQTERIRKLHDHAVNVVFGGGPGAVHSHAAE